MVHDNAQIRNNAKAKDHTKRREKGRRNARSRRGLMRKSLAIVATGGLALGLGAGALLGRASMRS